MLASLMGSDELQGAEEGAERFAAVLRAATEYSIIGTDLTGVITVFNAGAERMLGYEAAEVVGQATPLLIHDPKEVAARAAELDVAPGFEVFVREACRRGAETREWTYICKDGRRVPVSLTVTPMGDAAGRPRGYIGIARDISERRRAEEEIRLLSTVLLAICAVDDFHEMLRVTLERVCAATGWVVGQAWVPADDGKRLACSSAWHVHADAAGGALMERLHAFRAASEALTIRGGCGLAGTAWSTGQPQWVPDVAADRRFLRRAAARAAGLRAGLAVPVLAGRPHDPAGFDDLTRPGDPAAPGSPVVAVLEFFLFEPRPVDDHLVGVVAGVAAQLGAVLRHRRVEQERAELRRRERAARAEAEQLKSDFIANVSHHLRTPLAAIQFSLDVVRANLPAGTPEALLRLLANADAAAARLTELITMLIELTRLQAGRVHLARGRHDLREIVTRAVRLTEPLARMRGQCVEVSLPRGPAWAPVDAGRIEMAVLKVLANAHEYGREGGTIGVRVTRRRHEVIVSVRDDGPGIPLTEQERIFQRFYQWPEAGASGLGLGLTIARALVELHGGRIWVESRPGEGATFSLALPTTAPAPDSVPGPGTVPVPGAARASRTAPASAPDSIRATSSLAHHRRARVRPGVRRDLNRENPHRRR